MVAVTVYISMGYNRGDIISVCHLNSWHVVCYTMYVSRRFGWLVPSHHVGARVYPYTYKVYIL